MWPFGDCGDLGRKPQWDHDQRFAAIGADDQQIVAVEPFVQSAESATPAFDLDAAIDAQERHAEITTETSTRRPTQGHAFCCEATLLQIAHEQALPAISLLPGGAAATLLGGMAH